MYSVLKNDKSKGPKHIAGFALTLFGAFALLLVSCGDSGNAAQTGANAAGNQSGGNQGGANFQAGTQGNANFQAGGNQGGAQGSQVNPVADQTGGNFQGGGQRAAGGQAGANAQGQGGAAGGQAGGQANFNRQGGAGAYGGQGAGQGGGQGGARFARVQVQTVSIQTGNLNADRQTAGVISANTESQVAATASGVVSRVLRNPGDWVKRGDLIIQLDDAQASLSLRTAQASLDNANINLSVGQDNNNQAGPKLDLQLQSAQSSLASAQKNYDATAALYKLGGNSGADLDNAQSQLQTAQANLESAKIAVDQNTNAGTQNLAQLKIAVTQASIQVEQARLNLANTSIRAPFDGQISAIKVKQGEYLGQNSPAIVLVSAGRQINFSVSPDDAPRLTKGAAVIFTFGGQAYSGLLTQTPPAPTNGSVSLIATADGISALPYGSVGIINYTVSLAKGTLLPLAALQASGSKTIAYFVQNNKAKLQEVKVIAQAGTVIAIEGDFDGAQAIINPPPGLVDGASVQVVNPQAAGATAAQPANAAKQQGQGAQGQNGQKRQYQGQGTGQGQGSGQGQYQGRRQGQGQATSPQPSQGGGS